nr:RdgB/HAM1 family non-canonical purine NTP pyrophosphatase [Peptoniphilus catoniae]
MFKNREEVLTKREKIVLSSDNKNKILEIKDILRGLPVDLLSKSQVGLGDMEVEENFESLEENAQIKAQEIKKRVDLSVIADDTGLFVEALNGEPGVHSARYAGEHDDAANRRKLLESMKEKENRKAYFKTVISYIEKSGKEHLFQGICQGEIIREERGENGFGYDSLFLPKGFNKTFAEMTEEDKNKISHRSKALEEFRKFLEEKHS